MSEEENPNMSNDHDDGEKAPPSRMVITQMKHPGELEGEQADAMKVARANIEKRAACGGFTDLEWETIDGAKHKLDRLTGVKT